MIWLVRNLKVPGLDLRFLGFTTRPSNRAGQLVLYDVNDRSSRHQATERKLRRQFRRLKMEMPQPLQRVRPKNARSEGVLEQIAIEVQWNQRGCDAFRYVMAVAAISRFWRTHEMHRPVHPIFMNCWRAADRSSWQVSFHEKRGAESIPLRKWECEADENLIAVAKNGRVPRKTMLGLIKAGSGEVRLMLTRQQYQRLTTR